MYTQYTDHKGVKNRGPRIVEDVVPTSPETPKRVKISEQVANVDGPKPVKQLGAHYDGIYLLRIKVDVAISSVLGESLMTLTDLKSISKTTPFIESECLWFGLEMSVRLMKDIDRHDKKFMISSGRVDVNRVTRRFVRTMFKRICMGFYRDLFCRSSRSFGDMYNCFRSYLGFVVDLFDTKSTHVMLQWIDLFDNKFGTAQYDVFHTEVCSMSGLCENRHYFFYEKKKQRGVDKRELDCV